MVGIPCFSKSFYRTGAPAPPSRNRGAKITANPEFNKSFHGRLIVPNIILKYLYLPINAPKITIDVLSSILRFLFFDDFDFD